MPVDKFGRMSDAKTEDTGVSLTYINSNYIRSDGGTPVSGSIDMRGNTLYNVSYPKNPEDVATKDYADYVLFTIKDYVDYINNNYIHSEGSTPVSGSINMNGNTLYNVPDPVNPHDVATKEYADTTNKAFVLFEGKYLAVRDLSMGGRRLNDVGMSMENHQASNKFYVDTIVEAATAGDKALSKIQDGIFQSSGDIDMNGNSITGLPNPIDRDAAANKNYVDNGGAITKLPNGKFTVVSDIDFNGFSLKNIPEPIDEKDAVNKAYVDDKAIQPATPITKPTITVWAEEKGPLGNGHYEFSFGNGCSGAEHAYGGYCMSAPGRIIRGSLTATESRIILAKEIKVNIVVNGKEQVNQSIVKKSGDICSCTIFCDPIELNQCDVINLFREPPMIK